MTEGQNQQQIYTTVHISLRSQHLSYVVYRLQTPNRARLVCIKLPQQLLRWDSRLQKYCMLLYVITNLRIFINYQKQNQQLKVRVYDENLIIVSAFRTQEQEVQGSSFAVCFFMFYVLHINYELLKT